ncbi:MAG: response regulator transcription factor [Eggerthella lenta]
MTTRPTGGSVCADRGALALSRARPMCFRCCWRRTISRIRALFISAGTVSTHIRHIYQKTGVDNRQELIDLARDGRGRGGLGDGDGVSAGSRRWPVWQLHGGCARLHLTQSTLSKHVALLSANSPTCSYATAAA